MKLGSILLLLMSTLVFASERTVEKSFEVEPNATLGLNSHKGKITIRPHAADTIVINARIYMSGDHKMSSETVERLVEAVEVRFSNSPSQVSVSVDYNNTQSIFDALMSKQQTNPTVDFEVFVPQAGSLKLTSHKGSMDVEAPSGAVAVESHKGSGSLKGLRGPLDLITHKGSFNVQVEDLRDIRIESHKGSVELVLANAADFKIAGRSHKGTFSFEGRDISLNNGERHGVSVDYSEGSGEHSIDLTTHKGSISLRFED